VGAVHHIAWRARYDKEQKEIREAIIATGRPVTPVMDRLYFRSVYFHEPSGVLLEVATDPPGFTRDEPADSLGSRLSLPPWLERLRSGLEKSLPPLGAGHSLEPGETWTQAG